MSIYVGGNIKHNCPSVAFLFRTGRLRTLSFGAKISVHLSEALRECCGNCTKYDQVTLSPPLSDVPKAVVDTLDIIYPVYSQLNAIEFDEQFNFIPVLRFQHHLGINSAKIST